MTRSESIPSRLIFLVLLFCSLKSLAQYDDGTRYAFTSSLTDRSIHVIDVHKQELADRISLDAAPSSVTASDRLKALIVSHIEDKKLTLIDLQSKQLTQINYPLNIRPERVYLSPLGDTVAIHDQSQKVLEIHALRRKTVLLKFESIDSADSLTFNLDGSKVFWVDHTRGFLNSIDLWSKEQTVKISEPNQKMSALTRSTDGRLGFISNYDKNQVSVVDLEQFKVITQIPVGSGPTRPWGTSDGELMLVPNSKDGTLTAITTLSLRTLYTVPALPDSVSINPGWLDSVAAVVGKSGEVLFIETASGKQLASNVIGDAANEGVVTADSKTLTISSTEGVSFFDMRKRSLLGSVGKLPADISTASLAVSNNLCH